ncbi:hypothetical protein ONZ45_g19312 [Pleurotus djamor]|nr:hypothetical protein ONZ45_g19312 [Pleurotus djamor]
MKSLSNELIRMIASHLPLSVVQTFRNVCRRTRQTILPQPHIGDVTESISPFFEDVEAFRVHCMQPFECVIAGAVPFIVMSGGRIVPTDVLDIFVTRTDSLPFCVALEVQGCMFHTSSREIVTAQELLSCVSKRLSLRDTTTFPPIATATVSEKDGFPSPPRLGSTFSKRHSIDPVLVSLVASTPRGRWMRVHVLKTGRPVGDVVYAMPSTAYLHFISHEELYSFSSYPTFFHGCHVTFQRHLPFTPVTWPPPSSLKCVAKDLLSVFHPYGRIKGLSLTSRVWVKPWDDDKGYWVDLSRRDARDLKKKPYAKPEFEIAEMAFQWPMNMHGEAPNTGLTKLYSHAPLTKTLRTNSSDADVGIMPKRLRYRMAA